MIASLPIRIAASELDNKGQWAVKITEDVIVETADGKKLGQLNSGVLVYTEAEPTGEEVTIQWSDTSVRINSVDYEKIDVSGLKPYQEIESSSLVGTLTSTESTITIINEQQEEIGYISSNVEYPVIGVDENYFHILVGNIKYFVNRVDYEGDFQPVVETVSENVEEAEIDPALKESEEQSIGHDEEKKDAVNENTTNDQTDESNYNGELSENTQNHVETIDHTYMEDEGKSLTSLEDHSVTIKSTSFTKTTKYFKVIDERVPVYDNRYTPMKLVGYLYKGQVYPRLQDYTSWHKIQFRDYYGFVPKSGTVPGEVSALQNENTKYTNGTRKIVALKDIEVYDNSSGQLVPFAKILEGEQYPIVKEYTSWYSVLVADRIGYVKKSDVKKVFLPSDKYFKVVNDKVPVYDNSSGKLVVVGYLEKGSVFPRINHFTSWHEIQFGHISGYVHHSETIPDNGSSITNFAKSSKTNGRKIIPITDTIVYDNTKPGPLRPFVTLKSGISYPVVDEYTSWYKVNVAGLEGYVRKSEVKQEFLTSDRYFKVLEDHVPIYDNRSGSLVQVGTLTKGQVYPRTRDYTSWHQIQFGDFYAYVPKAPTAPASGSVLKNENDRYKNRKMYFIAIEDVPVYDNSSGKLVQIGTINKGQSYPVTTGDFTSWWRIIFADRIAYVNKELAIGGKVTEKTYTNYNYSLSEMVDKQMTVNPQTDLYKYGYVSGAHINTDKSVPFPKQGTVTASKLNIRSTNSTSGTIYTTVDNGTKLTLVAEYSNGWYKVVYPKQWANAERSDVEYYVNPNNFINNSTAMFMFLVLSKPANVSVYDMNNLLKGKGILDGMGEAFITASKKYSINEIYLVSHALLETGNGTSQLANGVKYEGKTVYNMYGIGAYDASPIESGAKYAYEQGWFTPETAIIEGAKFIGSSYINNPYYQQDTLYKMRWNPANPATHQYATDIGWADKQTYNIAKLYSLLNSYVLYLDIPKYK